MIAALAVLAALALSACGQPPRGPYFGDERFLVLGVEPGQEADALASQLENAGFQVQQRFAGQNFEAIGFADAQGRSSVRVVTPRGIALVLDPVDGDVFTAALRYRLLEPPIAPQHDADGDGFEEVFVERIEGPVPDRCLLVFRVRDSGFVDPVWGGVAIAGMPRRDEPLWLEPYFCPGGDVADGGVQEGDAPADDLPSGAPDAAQPPSEKEAASPASP